MNDKLKHPTRKLSDAQGFDVPLQGSSGESVTPDDDKILVPGNLFVGNGGTLVVKLVNSSETLTFENIPDGSFLPILVTKVFSATTATSIIILR